MDSYYAHPTALVESRQIGEGSRIWAFAHVMDGAVIGKQCNIGDHSFIESGVIVGDNVTIKNQVAVWEGVHIAQNAFIGPNVVFTNDMRPRSARLPLVTGRYRQKSTWLKETYINEGASLGANATILCGVEIGEYAMIGAGALVVKTVPAYTLVYGSPAKIYGYVCRCGEKLEFAGELAACAVCRSEFRKESQQIQFVRTP